jgi:hypothetical protein
MKIKLVAILCVLPILVFSQKSSIEIGVGYQSGLTIDLEARINKDGDELRTFFYRDYWHPINKFAILYQPYILPVGHQKIWQHLKPIGAFGFNIGYWRDRRRTWPADATGNSPWKKNPTVGIVILVGWEYTIGKFALDAYAMGGADIVGVNDWTRGLGTTLKFRF